MSARCPAHLSPPPFSAHFYHKVLKLMSAECVCECASERGIIPKMKALLISKKAAENGEKGAQSSQLAAIIIENC